MTEPREKKTSSYTTIQIPREIADRIEFFVRGEGNKKYGFRNRSEAIMHCLRSWLDLGINYFLGGSRRQQQYAIERVEQILDTAIIEAKQVRKDIFDYCDVLVSIRGTLAGNDLIITLRADQNAIKNPGNYNRIPDLGAYLRGKFAHLIQHVNPSTLVEAEILFDVILTVPASTPPITMLCEGSIKIRGNADKAKN